MDWCMIKDVVRYTRIPDPAHVLSARGGQGGRNKIQIITGGEALLKMSVRVLLIFFNVPTRWDPVLENPIKGSFIHSFIHDPKTVPRLRPWPPPAWPLASQRRTGSTPLSAAPLIRHPDASHQDAARTQHGLHQPQVVILNLAALHVHGQPWLSTPISISTSPSGRASLSTKPFVRGSLVTM